MPKALCITFKGTTLNVREWSERTGIDHRTIAYRLNAGWPVENALSTKAWGPRPEQQSLVDALPALKHVKDDVSRARRDMRRALRVLIRDTEKQAADIGRAYALAVASTLDQAQRGADQNFLKSAGDRIPSSAQERP